MEAVKCLHSKNLLHRDIKPDNILVMDSLASSIKISDLGLSCSLMDEAELRVKCGTPGYCDPQVLQGRKFERKSDIFSIGCLMFNIATKQNLFSGYTCNQIIKQNITFNPIKKIDKFCSHLTTEARDLLKRMLQPETSDRPLVEECLKHEWF